MSDRTDTGQSDSVTAPVFSHIIVNVESFAHWFANMQPSWITEIPQTLQYRLQSQRVLLEIQSILFSFKSKHPQAEILKYEVVAFWIFVYICSTWSSQSGSRSLLLLLPTCPILPEQKAEQPQWEKTSICLSSLRKLRQPWLTGWAKGPEMWFLRRTLSSLMTFKLHF